MSFLNKLGRIFGLFVSVFIITAVFLSYLSIDIMSYSVFSMSLFEINRIGAIVIIILAIFSFIASYNNKGFLVSFLGIIILAANVYFACHISFGNEQIDSIVNQLTSILGDFFTPGIGFIVISVGSIVLFLSGLMINKEKGEDSKKLSKKAKSIIVSVVVLVCVGAGGIVCFVYPGYYFKTKMVVDERTGKKFDLVDGKVKVYLPVKVTYESDDKSDNSYEINMKYDDKARLIEKNSDGYDTNGKKVNSKSIYTYDIDGRLSHISEDVSNYDFINDWNIEYNDGYIKTIIKEDKSETIGEDTTKKDSYIYNEYNTSGLLVNSYSSTSKTNVFEKTNNRIYTYNYDESGYLNNINLNSEFNIYNMDLRYDNGLINEAVSEGMAETEEFNHNDIIYSRDHNHITHIDHKNVTGSNTSDYNVSYTYDKDLLTKIDLKDEEGTINSTYSADISYNDNLISNISYSYDMNNKTTSGDISFEYNDGEVTEIRNSETNPSGKVDKTYHIEYEQFLIDKDEWNNRYRDYYYSYRYEVLRVPFDSSFYFEWSGFYELYEGYFDQYSEYYATGLVWNNDRWFSWVTLPKVIGRNYYSINEQ